jgi:homoserine O-acetyltransferase
LFNPNEYFIICANVIGSHYGSTGPLSVNPDTGSPYYHNFPEITVRDIINSLNFLREHLQIKKINLLIGGSLGGQQALEWSISNSNIIENLILIATNAQHSPWGIAFNESQRLAITADRTWYNNSPDAGAKGLKAARSIALLSYRNYNTYLHTQKDEDDKIENFKAVSYQNYQGKKIVNRFNAFSYWYLSKVMDSHNVGRNRGGISNALSIVKAKTLIIAINSDLIFPVIESEILHKGITGSKLEIIDSLYGHDGFLIETEILTKIFELQLKKSKVYEQ